MRNVNKHSDSTVANYVTFSCYKNFTLLQDPILCDMFVDILKQERKKLSFDLWAYVIMYNHVHLILRTSEYPVSRVLQGIKGDFSKLALEHIRMTDSGLVQSLRVLTGRKSQSRFWQAGGGWNRILQGSDLVREYFEYIHNNPVKAGYVSLPEQWKWSSASYWILDQKEPIAMDEMPFLIS